ncbi:GNAT family N-acetyltransferase [bacterium]|nr:GNAT family N-acetyltransferase [bacterium]
MDADGPVIETARLTLRPPRQADFESWAAFMDDEPAARYIGGRQPAPVAWRGLATMAGSWALLGFGMFSVIERASGRWVGRVGPWAPHGWPGLEVGWGVIREVWGRGYAFEAAVASMDFAVDHLGWSDIIHSIDPANTASQALAARLGSANRGPGRMPPPFEASPVELWGQTADQWREARARLAGASAIMPGRA